MFIAKPRKIAAPRGLEPVHLGQHVADHVGQREDDEPAVGDDRAERDALGRGHVGDDHQRGEDGDEDRIVGRPDLSERGMLLFGGGLVACHPAIIRSGERLGDQRRQLVGHHRIGQRRRERDRAGEILAGEHIALADRSPAALRRSDRQAARPARRRSRCSRSARRRRRGPTPSCRAAPTPPPVSGMVKPILVRKSVRQPAVVTRTLSS